MIIVLLIVHGLLAVALLGAITHQAWSVAPRRVPVGPLSFVGRFRSVDSSGYATAVVVLFVVTAIGGGLLYPQYRLDVRTALEDLQLRAANGIFEIKEHLIAVGLGALPAYWLSWRTPLAPEFASTRRNLTWILAFFVWWAFLVGHLLNNFKGLLPH